MISIILLKAQSRIYTQYIWMCQKKINTKIKLE